MLAMLAKNPKVAPLALLLPSCVKGMIADAEWLAYGTWSIASQGGTLIVRGRWTDTDVASCFSAAGVRAATWNVIDKHTIRVTLGDGPAAATKGPDKRMRQLLATLPAQRSIAVVADGAAKDDWSSLGLPPGSDVFSYIIVEPSGASLDLGADVHDAKTAQELVDKVKPELDAVFGQANTRATGRVEARREGTVVHVSGQLTSLMLGIVTSALQP